MAVEKKRVQNGKKKQKTRKGRKHKEEKTQSFQHGGGNGKQKIGESKQNRGGTHYHGWP